MVNIHNNYPSLRLYPCFCIPAFVIAVKMTHNSYYKSVFPVEINFDDARDAWMANKRKLANGMYRYICCATTKTGKQCSRTPEPNSEVCLIHRKKNKPTPSAKIPSFLSQIYGLLRQTISTDDRLVLILDVIDETILIRTTPITRGSFDQLYGMLDYYKSLYDISDDIEKNGLPTDIGHLMLCLQLMLSFLDGMGELTKLETKRLNVRRIQCRILEFNGYDPLKYMHITSARWVATSNVMKDHIISMMLYLFEQLESR